MANFRHSLRSLRSTLALVEKRERFEKQIQEINQQLSRALVGQNASQRGSGGTRKLAASKSPRRSSKRGKRGALKKAILSALHEAGEAGLAVKHLAQKIGAKPASVHVWFGTTGKKGGLTEAVGRGIYRLKRSMGVESPDGLKARKPKKRVKGVAKNKKATVSRS